MSRAEFLRWAEYARHQPFDPVSLHLRPAALVAYTIAASSMGGTKHSMRDYLDSLAPPDEEAEAWSIFNSFLQP